MRLPLDSKIVRHGPAGTQRHRGVEINRMRLEVREYLSLHPKELTATAQQAVSGSQESRSGSRGKVRI